ncbi:uncharacterized protein LOC110022279 [Phalaenopsis equestris]|uniref:uncharacterized protein LOC110022279 n=1 Tax=Phalaenopsis equestris TaxID=78828 RepID=UPI0009E2B454|nr:uncharacterized protein LOC110022279 [Phalaenopsis equestris]XP_020576795.1 uncharacterized protein LOC110022279 [Phalaenopsis equestris]XP_020576796.1 uncharacterized protein LOC110022279 [Phalaenopsis equestris]XP_020576797.1 uncharacterized protein LOC110022279 [Phalaenopsis equestris]
MARRGEEEEEEHHQNPFLSISCSKPSSSKLQFRKEVSRAQWDEKLEMGEVVEKKGSMWTTTGIIRNGKIYCHIEEIIFLAERGALHLLDSDEKVLSITDLYKKIPEGKHACSWENFEAYRLLKSLGYIIGRHGIPWTMNENKSVNSNISTDETNDIDMEYKISTLLKRMHIDEMKPTFDVYLPNKRFKKSSPGVPVFLLCVLKVNPPSRKEVESFERSSGGIPIKFCIVDYGQVSFFSFEKVKLPVLP